APHPPRLRLDDRRRACPRRRVRGRLAEPNPAPGRSLPVLGGHRQGRRRRPLAAPREQPGGGLFRRGV
ncbi:MAG: hypothetical protein AVDCRST_MAG59-1771, partial [uncultured Thermomicrobiales bacterium]